MTFPEFSDMLEGFMFEERRQDDVLNQRTAWQTAHVMNATGKLRSRVKPDDLYTPMSSQPEKEPDDQPNIITRFDSKEAKEKYLEDLQKKFERPDGSQ